MFEAINLCRQSAPPYVSFVVEPDQSCSRQARDPSPVQRRPADFVGNGYSRRRDYADCIGLRDQSNGVCLLCREWQCPGDRSCCQRNCNTPDILCRIRAAIRSRLLTRETATIQQALPSAVGITITAGDQRYHSASVAERGKCEWADHVEGKRERRQPDRIRLLCGGQYQSRNSNTYKWCGDFANVVCRCRQLRYVTATYKGDQNNSPSTSSGVTIVIAAPDFTIDGYADLGIHHARPNGDLHLHGNSCGRLLRAQ